MTASMAVGRNRDAGGSRTANRPRILLRGLLPMIDTSSGRMLPSLTHVRQAHGQTAGRHRLLTCWEMGEGTFVDRGGSLIDRQHLTGCEWRWHVNDRR